jgi:hypothetical protein
MTEPRKIRRVDEAEDGETVSGPMSTVEQYLKYRWGREGLQTLEDSTKKELMAWLESHGENEDGHRYFHLPYPVDNGKTVVTGVKRERRSSSVMDADAAMALVEKYSLQETCVEMVPVLNEDALLAANFEGAIPDEEFKAIYTEKETFAFILLKEK